MFPIIGLATVFIFFTLVAVAVASLVPRVRLSVGSVLSFAIMAVPSAYAVAFAVGRILGDQYTFPEGMTAMVVGGVAGGLAGLFSWTRFLKRSKKDDFK